MAERRMFKKSIMRSASFMQLSRAAVQLYLYLCLEADDDGFVENAWAVSRICKCSRKHLQELIDGGWVIPFESGVAAITHWHMHNRIPKDRFKSTDFQKERASLEKSKQGVYTKCIQDDNNLYTQERIVQESLGQFSINQGNIEEDIPAGSSSGPPGAACDYENIDYERILGLYQMNCGNLEPCEALTPQLRQKIDDCFEAGYSLAYLAWAFIKAGNTAFLQGKNRRGWVAGLEWLLEPKHLKAVYEGKYDAWV